MPDELDALLGRVDDEALRKDLTAHISRLRQRRQFGLVFEEHLPERVVLPQHAIRRGTKVVTRDGGPDDEPRVVLKVRNGKATLAGVEKHETVDVSELVAVAEFGEPIYPGFKRLGSIERGGDKPSHVVIKGENYHALEALQFTHAGKVDCIYIDPPYNTGARDWKYNNDYVDGSDAYRHSKWLAFMKRRLVLAKVLLNPAESVLVVAIDEQEVSNLALLLARLFPESQIEQVTTVTNPRGKQRAGRFSRTDEYLFFVPLGRAALSGEPDPDYQSGTLVPWRTLRRSDLSSKRGTKKGGTQQFYPIYVSVDDTGPRIVEIGEPLPHAVDRTTVPIVEGCTAVFPVRDDDDRTEMNWGLTPGSLRELLSEGFVRVRNESNTSHPQPFQISYLTEGKAKDVRSGRAVIEGFEASGAVIARYVDHKLRMPKSVWEFETHNAEIYGTNLVKDLLGSKLFDYPKSLYAVIDSVSQYVGHKTDALVVDFFAGSGTTAHAVARMNQMDGGTRRSISITNNEVGDGEAVRLADAGLRLGEDEWEAQGIFELITKPRISAAVCGQTSKGDAVPGHYKVTGPVLLPCRCCAAKKKGKSEDEQLAIDESCTGAREVLGVMDGPDLACGLTENVEFLGLEYLDAETVALDRAFEAIAPLLWMRAGSRGPILTDVTDAGRRNPYLLGDAYAVLFNADSWRSFIDKLAPTVTHVFIVTDSASEFANVSAELPVGVDVVRLYENYLSTFAINTGAAS